MYTQVLFFDELSTEWRAQAGGKGASLARLVQAGFSVPDGFVILPDAFVDEELSPEAWRQIQTALNRLRTKTGHPAFAIRSSAMSEDSTQASFAGEFETILNVSTDSEIAGAICQVYRSRQNERVLAYSRTKGMVTEHQIAIIVQQLVRADSAGVLFTANPVTGQRDQAMISAAWGLGEAVVGGLVTPDTLVVDKDTGRVVSRETAVKQLMTVLTATGTQEQPVPETQQREPVLTDAQTAELVKLGVQIEQHFGMPMDIEWTLAGESFAIVQARPITALPEPEIVTDWQLPPGNYIAMRNNIVELMAEPLSPLFSTLGLQAVNSSMNRLLTTFFGRSDMMPEDLIITVKGYAYYNGSLSAKQMALIFWRSLYIARKMFTGAVNRWVGDGRPHYLTTVAGWQKRPWHTYSNQEILAGVRELAEAAIDAYGALVSGVIPAAWISEGIFTAVYKTLIKRRHEPDAPVFLMGFDSLPIRAEKNLYDLAEWVQTRPQLATYLRQTATPQLATHLLNEEIPSSLTPDDWTEWYQRAQFYLSQYGHTIYNLDFANPVPADDPAPWLEVCKLFVSGQGTNPHTRQQVAINRRVQAEKSITNRLGLLRRRLFCSTLTAAQRYAPLREDGLSDIGLSYPLLRQMLHEIGRRFVVAGALTNPKDIYWLTEEEVMQVSTILDRGNDPDRLADCIPSRKASQRAATQLTVPFSLMRLFHKDLKMYKSKRQRRVKGDILQGVAASPGQVTAQARVLNGPEDFAQMQKGDVLVAAITTPAWTPLFAMASGIVTDVGGPLSHGSIVAREYGIPAVLGTGSATKRVHNGDTITVDGSAGKVLLKIKETT